jgi:signal peptidase I
MSSNHINQIIDGNMNDERTHNHQLKDNESIDDVVDSVVEMTTSSVVIFFLELVKVVFIAGVTIFLVRHFLFKPFTVKGQSMEPTYMGQEYLIVDEISYRFRVPQRGEVVVFKSPVGSGDHYLKRIIGLPGERVTVEDNHVIIYNKDHPQGVLLEEDYLFEETTGSISVTLEANHYFVMGDNRDASFDSRRFGAIDRDAILGRSYMRGWPLHRVTVFGVPEYNF